MGAGKSLIKIFKAVKLNMQKQSKQGKLKGISLRKFPYPYKAALAISSDVDDLVFEDLLEIHRFLNTRQQTTMGPGLGLEIGDTFWMYSTDLENLDPVSYFKGTTTDVSDYVEVMRKLIRAGYIDCLHTYGDFNRYGGFIREMAAQSISELKKQGLKIDVWINHGDRHNLQNIGWVGYLGDLPYATSVFGARTRVLEYHCDITTAYGIRFVWKGDLTTLVGQDCPYNFRQNVVLICKQLIKKWLLKRSDIHNNDLIQIMELRDGSKVNIFKRFGSWSEETSDDLPGLISGINLNILKRKNGYMIVYTHLGKTRMKKPPLLSIETQEALKTLAEEYYNGEIYITTTSKLLNYNIVHKSLCWHSAVENGLMSIIIYKVADTVRGDYIPTPEQLRGITFYTPHAEKTRVFINSAEIADIERNTRDYTGKESVSIPLDHMQYPLSE
ncbi:hypothetical protein ACFLUU_03295 [Chloroflexota bacterium]